MLNSRLYQPLENCMSENDTVTSHAIIPRRQTNVGTTGTLYTYNNLDNIVSEIGQAYARRNNLSRFSSDARRGNISGILNIIDLLSSAIDLSGSALSLPNPVPNRIKHRITFKNEADIILVPAQINVPDGYHYNTMPKILFPGEVCVFSESHNKNNSNLRDRLSFAFGAISTDPAILPLDTPRNSAAVFPFEIWIGRNNHHVTFERVHGFVEDHHNVFNLTVNTRATPAPLSETRLQYAGFRGARGTTMPSFGMALVETRSTAAAETTVGTQITFTPL